MPHANSEEPLRLPVELARTPGALPDRCSRHGRPAVRRVDLALQSEVRPESGGRTNLPGLVGRFAEYGRTVQVADVRAWPLCRSCARTRTVWFGLSLVLFWGGLVVFAGTMLLGLLDVGAGGSMAAVACGGLAGMLAAVLPFRRGSLPRLIGARTAPDGRELIVERAHPAFAAALHGGGSDR